MNRLGWILAAGAIVAINHVARGGDGPGANEALKVVLELSDGSRVIGTPDVATVPVQTLYAKMDIPLKQILSIKMGVDHETASLVLRNGDTLQGVVSIGPVKLETLFGKASIAVEHIRELHLVSARRGLPGSLQNGLVLYCPFDTDEGDNVTDASGKKHHGKPHGTTWTAQGKVGGACRFDGAKSHVVSSDPIGISQANPNTVCAWFKSGKAATHKCVWSMGNGHGAGENEHGICVQTTTLKIHHGGIGDTITTTIDPGQWTFVCRTYDGTTQSLYVNGALAGKEQRAMNLADHPVNIGRWKAGSDYAYYFDGVIDEVMIFDRALSGDEAKALYDTQK